MNSTQDHPSTMSTMKPKPVLIRQVWAVNLETEINHIRQNIPHYPFISMDTEFPGVIFNSADRNLPPSDNYRMIKKNVDALNLIQIGLTLSDAAGNLPGLGTNCSFIWEFNFSDFDVTHDDQNPDSIALLRRQGIDFSRNAAVGIDSARFAHLMMRSGLLHNNAVTWVTFHSAYDFAYLVKIMTRRSLPNRLEGFLRLVRLLFGSNVYDIKHMMRFCNNLYGGLDRIAQTLNVDRSVGKSHQAGSDSLLTWRVFQKMQETCFVKDDGHRKHVNVLHGLELDSPFGLNMYHQSCSNGVGLVTPMLEARAASC